ncbi:MULTISPECIES: sugar phosphate isomerase/epimerase family protein [Clostridium]|uniref:Xylose isomerase-like TIM barrel n=2 Tax=Clostridium TaxID=1485 RepID=A0A151APV9_9CLOT|nr:MULTISPECIES: sugar phosphate isomerase/epimerase family protein [Clostridium]KYH29655.1 xylose isomerase-like TIM barrel [Clostridium colicanis DSM 13634]MBE6043957.1 sugar phosphate isomerase/epimerase [Clostridium thermopalmarium]PRR72106.1 Xylose isomerase-like TIM barrel [Clostridium thermopalmarium DSM 5974]PVZ23758.1 sugar phosphate isomerase/epimerase [Clostridium thermopalmarium DSM 5974]
MKIGYAASAGEKNIYDTIDYAYNNKFSAVELNINMPIFFPERFDTNERKKVKEYAKEKGIELTFHAPEDISLLQLQKGMREAGIARLKEVMDFAYDLGASRLTMHIGGAVCFTLTDRKVYMDELFYDDFKKVLDDSLKELIDYSKGKVKLCIENSGRFPQKLVQEALDEMISKEKDLFLTWDIGHSYENKYNEVEFFLRHLDRIRTCHLHDNNGSSDHQVIGQGNVDFKWHFEKMKNSDIIYIIEVRPREKAVESVAQLNL